MRVMVNLKCTINNMKRHFMRSQVKSVDGFAANRIRARLMVSELERLVLAESPATGRFERYEHLSRYIAASKNNSDFVLPRRSFFKWKKGEALPNSSTRLSLDALFPKERVGSSYGDRHNNNVEQTLLCALDLISEHAILEKTAHLEVQEIFCSIQSSWKSKIKSTIRLEQPHLTNYAQLNIHFSQASLPSQERLHKISNTPVAHQEITAQFDPYDTARHFDGLLMYLIKPRNAVDLDDKLIYLLVVDLISSAIASFILMLFLNPVELKNGGKMVERYRLIYSTLFCPKAKKQSDFYLNNYLPTLYASEAERLSEVLKKSFDKFLKKTNLTIENFNRIIAPLNPNNAEAVFRWANRD